MKNTQKMGDNEKLGDFELNKIYCMDCLEALKKIPDNSVDLVVTDPPYGMRFRSNYRKEKHEYIKGDESFDIKLFLCELLRISRRGVYIFCRWDNLINDLDAGFTKPSSVLVWVKNNWSMGDLKHEHGRKYESIIFYACEEHQFNKRIPDVLICNRTNNKLHPTQKPLELIKKIIKSNVGEIVLDPFMGSGTTAVACKQLGRKFLGFELEQKYVDIANKRLAQEALF